MVSKGLTVLLGVFYLTSGIGKLLDVSSFIVTLWSYGLPGEVITYLGIIVPPIEILLGIGLVLFIKNRALALSSAMLLLILTAAFAYAHFAKGVNDCGCFGMVSALESSPVLSLVRNFVAFGVSLFVFKNPVIARRDGIARWQAIALCTIGAASFALSGMSSYEPLVTSDPFVNKRVEDTPFSSLVHTSPDSTYLMFVMSVTCPHCWSATENVKAYKKLGWVDDILAFSSGTDSAAAVYRERFLPNFTVRMIDKKLLAKISGGQVPKLYFVRNDSIIYTPQGEVPSPWSLEFEIKARKQ